MLGIPSLVFTGNIFHIDQHSTYQLYSPGFNVRACIFFSLSSSGDVQVSDIFLGFFSTEGSVLFY